MEKILEKISNRYEAIRVMAREARRINMLIQLAGGEIVEKPTSNAIRRVINVKVKNTYEEPEGE